LFEARYGFLDAKGRRTDSVTHLLKQSLKLRNQDVDDVNRMLASLSMLDNIYSSNHDDKTLCRVAAGSFVRQVGVPWRAAVLLYEAVHNQRCSIVADIEAAGLGDAHTWKPVVSGTELVTALSLPRGPVVGEWVKRAWDVQFEHPDWTREQVIAVMKEVQVQKQLEKQQQSQQPQEENPSG
jgi:hypothetical protein